MKKVFMFFVLSFSFIFSMNCIQPALTKEMIDIGLFPFPTREQQIVDIYLIDDETWEKNMHFAQKQFEDIQEEIKTAGKKKEIVKKIWNLSKQYDFGLANKMLYLIFFDGLFQMKKNKDWKNFFSKGERPHTIHHMRNWLRIAYQEQEILYKSIVEKQKEKNKEDEWEDCTTTDDESLKTLLVFEQQEKHPLLSNAEDSPKKKLRERQYLKSERKEKEEISQKQAFSFWEYIGWTTTNKQQKVKVH